MKNLLDFVPLTFFASLLQVQGQTQIDAFLLTGGLFLGLVLSCFRLYFLIRDTMKDGKITEQEAAQILQELEKAVATIKEHNQNKNATTEDSTAQDSRINDSNRRETRKYPESLEGN